MHHIAPAGRDDSQIYQVQIGHIVYIEVAGDSGSTGAIGATDDDGELGSPAPIFPIIGHPRRVIHATHQHDLIAGGEGGIGGDAVPDGTHAPFGTRATGAVVGITTGSGIDPNRLQGGGAHIIKPWIAVGLHGYTHNAQQRYDQDTDEELWHP